MHRNRLFVKPLSLFGVFSAMALLGVALAFAEGDGKDEPDSQPSSQPTSQPSYGGHLMNEIDPHTGEKASKQFFADYMDMENLVFARIYASSAESAEAMAESQETLKEAYTKAFLTRPDGTQVKYGETALDIGNATCPASGHGVGFASLNYNAASINMCCAGCTGKIVRNPDYFLGQIKDDIAKAEAAASEAGEDESEEETGEEG